jgi:hypothetical protein
MGVTTTNNKPFNPRGNDQSPKGYNRASLFSGKALDFDGANDYVDGGTLDITAYTQMSVSFYMNVDTTTQDFRLISIRYSGADDIRIFHSVSIGGGVLNFSLDDGDVDNIGVNFETNEWYHVVMTHDGTTLKAYFNGIEQASTASTFDYANADGLFYIGRYTGGSVTFYDGEASNFKIFNTALTAAQVADLYNNPEKVVPTGLESNLKLWLPMMEGAGTTAYDGSGNGNHGTISGATYVNGIGAPSPQSAVMDWNKDVNLAPYSEDFTQSVYTKTGVVLTANDIVSPNGLTTGTKVSMNQDAESGVKIFTPMNAGAYTMNYFAKAGTITNAKFYQIEQGVAERYMDIDLANGTISNVPSAWDSASIQDAGNGWYLISVTNTMDAYHSGHGYGLVVSNENGNYFYLWGFHHKEATTLKTYVPNFTASSLTSPVLLPQGLTTGRDITGVNLFENVRKQGALNLDGNSWAEVHDNESLDMTTTATMEAWVNCDDLVAAYQIIMVKSSDTYWTGNYGRYTLRANQNSVNWWFDDYTANSKTHSISLSGYNHLVVTKDGTEEKLYINGALVSTQTGAATFTASPYSLVIGAQSSYAENWDNQLAQPRIYNRALTAEEVQRNYNAGKNTYTN